MLDQTRTDCQAKDAIIKNLMNQFNQPTRKLEVGTSKNRAKQPIKKEINSSDVSRLNRGRVKQEDIQIKEEVDYNPNFATTLINGRLDKPMTISTLPGVKIYHVPVGKPRQTNNGRQQVNNFI